MRNNFWVTIYLSSSSHTHFLDVCRLAIAAASLPPPTLRAFNAYVLKHQTQCWKSNSESSGFTQRKQTQCADSSASPLLQISSFHVKGQSLMARRMSRLLSSLAAPQLHGNLQGNSPTSKCGGSNSIWSGGEPKSKASKSKSALKSFENSAGSLFQEETWRHNYCNLFATLPLMTHAELYFCLSIATIKKKKSFTTTIVIIFKCNKVRSICWSPLNESGMDSIFSASIILQRWQALCLAAQ